LSKRSEPKMGWSGELLLQRNDGAERSGSSQSGNGAGSGGCRNRL